MQSPQKVPELGIQTQDLLEARELNKIKMLNPNSFESGVHQNINELP